MLLSTRGHCECKAVCLLCSKSHNLVSNVKDIFDTMENCFAENDLSTILAVIDESADSILDRKCGMTSR